MKDNATDREVRTPSGRTNAAFGNAAKPAWLSRCGPTRSRSRRCLVVNAVGVLRSLHDAASFHGNVQMLQARIPGFGANKDFASDGLMKRFPASHRANGIVGLHGRGVALRDTARPRRVWEVNRPRQSWVLLSSGRRGSRIVVRPLRDEGHDDDNGTSKDRQRKDSERPKLHRPPKPRDADHLSTTLELVCSRVRPSRHSRGEQA